MANDTELKCKWTFPLHSGGQEDGPNDSMTESFKKNPYASLIRESIQNSLDVPLYPDRPIKMEFTIGRLQTKNYPNLFALNKHVKGCLDHFANNDDAKAIYRPMLHILDEANTQYGKLSYIKVSDYNTTGMDYRKGDTTAAFYAFAISKGVSSKENMSAGGSFGYGKAAYFNISPIKTILISTLTHNGKHFFEGVSTLCTHTVDGESELYDSVGYYNVGGGNEPVSIPDEIPSKFRREEVGTDIYILEEYLDEGKKEEITKKMTEAVLRNFWMAIYSGKLEVSICNNQINRDNISFLMEEYFSDELDEKARERDYNPRPYLDAVVNAGKDENHIVISKTMPTLGDVRLYILKNKKAQDKIVYMRSPLMVVKARRTHGSFGFFGVFICDDKRGNELLRKTENASHDEWDKRNGRKGGRYPEECKTAVDEVDEFIKDSIDEMFSSKADTIQEINGLEDFLYIPTAIEDDMEDEMNIVEACTNSNEEGNPSMSLSTRENGRTTPTIGKVLVSSSLNSKLTKSSEGVLLSGHGDKARRNKGGGGITAKNIDARYTESEYGINGNALKEIPVRYRSFAQMRNKSIVHILIIHSDVEIENARLDILVGGEQNNDAVAVSKCSENCVVENNTLSNIHIHEGKNVLEIIFADNMKHAIKLDAYELE